jgi:hypothetical protein
METVDIGRFKEYVDEQRPVEFALEYYYRKPLKACSLQEIVDGLIHIIRSQGGIADSLNCVDDGKYYQINMTHCLGINYSKTMAMMQESLFKSYGVDYESHFSERSIFFKIFKNQ